MVKPPVGGEPGPETPEPILLLAEHLKVAKRLVEGEGVRVRVVTDLEDVTASASLAAERLDITRIPVGRVVDQVPPLREEDGVIIIPVMTETVVVETRLVLKEELHIRRVSERQEHRQSVVLRHQRAEIEHLPATGRPIEPNQDPKRKDQP